MKENTHACLIQCESMLTFAHFLSEMQTVQAI